MMNRLLFLLVLSSVISGCGSDDIKIYRVPKHEDAGSPKPVQKENGHVHRPFDYDVPSEWNEQEASGMRLASFKAGNVDISLVRLGLAGGDLTQNVNRWRGQIELSHLDQDGVLKAAEKISVPLGNYYLWAIENPEHSQGGMLAAILRQKDAVLFIKAWGGPVETLALKSEFKEFIASLRVHRHD